MLGVVNAAKKAGFKAIGASGEYADLQKEKMPCIAHVVLPDGLQHFIVIYKIDDSGILAGDPGRGRYRMKKEEFLAIWKQKAVILLEPEKELLNRSVPHWLTWIYAYLKKQQAWIHQTIFLGLTYASLGLFTAVFIQWIIDRFIPEKDFEKTIYTGFFLLFILIVRGITGYLRGRFLVILNKRVNLNVTGDFLSHLF